MPQAEHRLTYILIKDTFTALEGLQFQIQEVLMTGRMPNAVLAGCGHLGIEVGRKLARNGYNVLALRRNVDRLPPDIPGQPVDLSTQLPLLPVQTNLVIGILAPGDAGGDSYEHTYVQGMASLLRAIETQLEHEPRIVWVSSTGVYGVDDGRWIDENTPAHPTGSSGEALIRAEQMLHAAHPTATVLRLAGLYGSSRSRLIDQIRNGEQIPMSSTRYTNRIHRHDAAQAVTHVATAIDNPNPLYLGTDHEPTRRNEVMQFIADLLQIPQPPSKPPTETHGGEPRGKRIRNDVLTQTGFTFRYPTYREGYRAIIAAQTHQ